MNITKIKRELAKRGIGDPLAQLFYSSREIEAMKRSGELIDPKIEQVRIKVIKEDIRNQNTRINKIKRKYIEATKVDIRFLSTNYRFEAKYKDKFSVIHDGFMIHKPFETEELATEWADWNYKGNKNFEIIKL